MDICDLSRKISFYQTKQRIIKEQEKLINQVFTMKSLKKLKDRQMNVRTNLFLGV